MTSNAVERRSLLMPPGDSQFSKTGGWYAAAALEVLAGSGRESGCTRWGRNCAGTAQTWRWNTVLQRGDVEGRTPCALQGKKKARGVVGLLRHRNAIVIDISEAL